MATKAAAKSQAKAKSKSSKTPPRRAKPAKAARKAPPPKSKSKPAKPAKPVKPTAKKAVSKPLKKSAAAKPAAKAVVDKKAKGVPPAKTVKAPVQMGGKPPAKGAAAKGAAAVEKPKKDSAKKASPATPVKGGAAAKKKPETPAKKKFLVGQKPRSPRSSATADFIVPLHLQKASHPVNETPVKASPASAEAKLDFKVHDHIVYPAHGVGRIVAIEKQTIAGVTNELFLIDFEQEKMKLRVPTAKAKAVGMRGLSDVAQVKKAVETLKGRARIKRTMWSRRAQEYEAKINSGDINAVAEVVRDLYRASDQPEQSYSERQLFEAALDRLAREVAAVNKTDMAAAIAVLDGALQQKKAA